MSDLPSPPSPRAVLKLDLGEDGGTRRVPLRRIWDGRSSSASYGKLAALAVGYATSSSSSAPSSSPSTLSPPPPDLADLGGVGGEWDASMTYVDEDGDVVALSSDAELADALSQFLPRSGGAGGVPSPPLRVRASVSRRAEGDGDGGGAAADRAPAAGDGDGGEGSQARIVAERVRSVLSILGPAVEELRDRLEATERAEAAKGGGDDDGATTARPGRHRRRGREEERGANRGEGGHSAGGGGARRTTGGEKRGRVRERRELRRLARILDKEERAKERAARRASRENTSRWAGGGKEE